jgi:tetratricopeptide (TPR) repeat protein
VIGDTDAALRCYSGFEEIARREQDPMYLMSYYRNIAEIMAMEQRRYAEAASFAERGVDLSVRLGEWWNRTEMTGTLAVTAAGRGDIARADQLIAEATKKKVGDVFADAYVAHCAARIHELAGRTAEADAAYRAATARYDTTGFRRGYFVSIAFLDHARLLHELGRDAEAAALLGEAEARLGTQQGGRADLVAKLRADIVRATTRR